ncbi:hypothetical protein BGPTRB_171 [Escherichia phage vB_Eco_BGP]
MRTPSGVLFLFSKDCIKLFTVWFLCDSIILHKQRRIK